MAPKHQIAAFLATALALWGKPRNSIALAYGNTLSRFWT